MTYKRLIIGDANITRFWPDCQSARPQLVAVPMRPAKCLDTLSSALSEVTDEFDCILISVLTSMLIDEASSADVSGSSFNIIRDAVRLISASAKKSSKVEVCNIRAVLDFYTRLKLVCVKFNTVTGFLIF